ncbi:MAG: outer membrane lipoprotein carrier protein LolA [Deltaproteobacteria bacterium GWC2_55_46]|nr:MAG: outer membrane lipoprotein carrier protein LolA [Deltaproteobacteria bacterium GWA2_55_82]OGQ64747.1 MAG: outer membrane lipoprotein carrier protein LolA [Deltaproteobacteria bacterium RIFCSPLOWO2_02_FULL_55_12]OIJ72592.1 MAG: outer membrane lipoprotein carrier protein LolA [Deltaproteobacteria bacterium GWC2_55_46]HCY11936.1 outer membrane lipoprotein carrier protein LolA [Deltaproteobacteria bacterium]
MIKSFITIFSLIIIAPSIAAADEASRIVARLQQAYEAISTVQASFTQEVSSKGLKQKQLSSGRVWFKKPGKMRWEYASPEGDLIVSDGRTFWLYQSDLNQVIEQKIAGAASSMATDFLSGVGELNRDFHIALAGSEEGFYRLKLTPKKAEPSLKALLLDVDKGSFLIKRSSVADNFGTETIIELNDIKTNEPLKDKLFKFTPPKGAQVVRPLK